MVCSILNDIERLEKNNGKFRLFILRKKIQEIFYDNVYFDKMCEAKRIFRTIIRIERQYIRIKYNNSHVLPLQEIYVEDTDDNKIICRYLNNITENI